MAGEARRGGAGRGGAGRGGCGRPRVRWEGGCGGGGAGGNGTPARAARTRATQLRAVARRAPLRPDAPQPRSAHAQPTLGHAPPAPSHDTGDASRRHARAAAAACAARGAAAAAATASGRHAGNHPRSAARHRHTRCRRGAAHPQLLPARRVATRGSPGRRRRRCLRPAQRRRPAAAAACLQRRQQGSRGGEQPQRARGRETAVLRLYRRRHLHRRHPALHRRPRRHHHRHHRLRHQRGPDHRHQRRRRRRRLLRHHQGGRGAARRRHPPRDVTAADGRGRAHAAQAQAPAGAARRAGPGPGSGRAGHPGGGRAGEGRGGAHAPRPLRRHRQAPRRGALHPTPAPTTKKNASTYDAPLAPAMTRKPPTTVHRASTTTTTTTTTPAATTTTTTTAAATTSTSTTAAPLEDEATVLPTATEPTDTDGEEGKTEAETATRRTRRPGSGSGGGKKKKNKNKRRKNRPGSASASGANGTALAESKVGEQADDGALANGTRPAHAKDRPLTTRIYNYLAREVMPSFGVGLLGLAITAGLAGLIMYPFGGGAAKRTYEVDAPALPSHGNFYYYGGDYDQGDDHGQAEESVIRKVFEGMQGAEGEQAEEQRYAGDGGDAAVAGGTVTTYAGDVHGGQPYAPQGFGGGPALAYNGAGNYYNVEQANKYYSSSPSGRVESGPMHTAPAPNATAADGRVRYHEAAPAPAAAPPSAPADAGGPSPNTQHITKKSDYYAYNSAGRVRYRDVGTGHVTADLTQAPRVRFREVGSDTVHYSLSDQTSSEGGVEHGPRHVRVRRQTLDMADIGRKMADAHRQMAAEVADFADHAKKVSDKSVELGNEIEMLFAKKGTKPKKPMQAAKPIKMKKEEKDDDCDEQVTKSVMDEEEDDELSTSIMDPENFTDGPSDYETHVELVTGVPDHTSVEELAEQVQDDGVMNEFESEMPVYVRPTYSSTEQVEADTTTTDTAEQPTTVPETSTGGAPDAAEATTVHSPRPPPQSSIVDLLKQIAQLKIRLGIDFLKSTSRAFASYLDGLQRNMEDAIKQGSTAQYRRTNFWNYRRSKRDAKKTFNLKKNKSKSD